MADVIFMLGLTITLLLIVLVNIQLNKQAQADLEDEKDREKKRQAALAAMGRGSAGKSLHLTTEETEKNEDRLYYLFSHTATPYQKSMAGPPKSFSEGQKRPAGLRPMMRKAAPGGDSEVPRVESEQILSEIEQAVREAQ